MPRNESPTLHKLIENYDIGYSKYQSDLDNMYYFIIRQMDEWMKIIAKGKFKPMAKKLIIILRATTTTYKEFRFEMQRYADIFADFADEKRLYATQREMMRNYFLKAKFK